MTPWEKNRWLARLLRPAGVGYGMLMEARNLFYDRGVFKVHTLPVPVVSIGNLSVGGTGKTPLTLEIAGGLLRRNPRLNLGVLSRGYRRKTQDGWLVSDGEKILATVETSGDEPLLVARRLPGVKVFVGADRVAVAKKALARFDLDLLILDDAFQHRRIHRDVDMVVVDGKRDLAAERVLPAGPMREFPRNIRRASCVVVTGGGTGTVPGLPKFLPPSVPVFRAELAVASVVEANSGKEVHPGTFAGKPVWAVCGIARPAAFLETLKDLGISVKGWTAFSDHHPYTPADFAEIALRVGNETAVVTTEKDWVKWEGRHPFREVYVVSVRMNVENGEDLYDFIEIIVYNRKKGVRGGTD